MDLSFKIQKTPGFIFEYLSNMQKFASVHPVITRIDDRGNENYLVHETLKLGFIPFSFTYPASIEKNRVSNVIIIRATVMKVTKIEMTFKLTRENDLTVVNENIKFSSPLPIKSMMENIFKKQHSQLFRNIELSKE